MSAVTFVHITDHHLSGRADGLTHGFASAESLRAVLRHVAEHVGDPLDFVVTTGDVAADPSARAYELAREVFGLEAAAAPPGPLRLRGNGLEGVPLYAVPGNHDDRDLFFRRLFGADPRPRLDASFEHGGVRFVCVDWGPQGQARAHDGLFSALERALADGAPAVVLMHHHVVPLDGGWLDELLPPEDQVDRFFELVSDAGVLAVLCGNAHVAYDRTVAGVPVLGTAATSFRFALTGQPLLTLEPPQYRLVRVEDGRLTSRLCDVPLPAA